jgi:hypothetical protein
LKVQYYFDTCQLKAKTSIEALYNQISTIANTNISDELDRQGSITIIAVSAANR